MDKLKLVPGLGLCLLLTVVADWMHKLPFPPFTV